MFDERQMEAIFRFVDDEAIFRFVDDDEAISHTTANWREYRTLFYVCRHTGCRCGDGCVLKWGNVDFERNEIRMVPLKTRNSSNVGVVVPMHEKLARELKSAVGRDPDFVNPRLAKTYERNNCVISRRCSAIIALATGEETSVAVEGRAKRTNRYGMHSFRHTFVSECLNAGVPYHIVQEMVGHTSDVTKTYTHINRDAVHREMERLNMRGEAKELEEAIRELDGKELKKIISAIRKARKRQG